MKTTCQECRMVVEAGEYHPYAACLMFKECSDGGEVMENLEAVMRKGAEKASNRIEQLEAEKADTKTNINNLLEVLDKNDFIASPEATAEITQAIFNLQGE